MNPHILFDLDGTLIDSAPSILASMQAAFDAAGLHPVRPLTHDLIGPPLNETLATLLLEKQAEQVPRLAELFKEHYDGTGYRDTLVYEGVAQMLQELRRHGYCLWIATNKRILPTRRIIEHLGWDSIFDEVHALDTFTPSLRGKADMLTALHTKLGAPAPYVGDRPEDTAASSKAGLPFLLVAWGYASADYLAQQPNKAKSTAELIQQLLAVTRHCTPATHQRMPI